MIRISDSSEGKLWKLKSNSLKSPKELSAHAPMEKRVLKSIINTFTGPLLSYAYGRYTRNCRTKDELHTPGVHN